MNVLGIQGIGMVARGLWFIDTVGYELGDIGSMGVGIGLGMRLVFWVGGWRWM